ncbi:MAG: hypothetical protein IKQ46_15955 [Bacteroidales bacterium]|nr:hypothetical protein [Bacteroidales bacterium]
MKPFFLIILLIFALKSAAQFSIITNGESQSVGAVEYDSVTNTVIFEASKDSLNTTKVWFNFGITGFRRDTVLSIRAFFDNKFHAPTYPVYHCGNGNWSRVKNVEPGRNFKVIISAISDTVFIASGYPYSLKNFNDFITKHHQSDYFPQIDTITVSKLGYPITMLTFSPKRTNKRTKLIWIICRQHAFESTASWVLEGMLGSLLDDKSIKKVHKKYIFKVVPFVDIDNVQLGQTGRMSKPKDYNRDWNSPIHHEIKAVEDEIFKSAKLYNYYMFWDVHGTFPGGELRNNFSYFDIYNYGEKSRRLKNYWSEFYKFCYYHPIPVPDSKKSYEGLTADWWNEIHFPDLEFVTTLEIDWTINPRNGFYTPEDFYEIGQNMIRALKKY